MKKTYAEKLKDPRWQKKRLEILSRDNFTCKCCFNTDKTLHVHHKIYESNNPWETSSIHLITLCEDCHENWNEIKLSNEADFLNTFYRLGFSPLDLSWFTTGFACNNETADEYLLKSLYVILINKEKRDEIIEFIKKRDEDFNNKQLEKK